MFLVVIVGGAFLISLLGLATLAAFGREPPTRMQERFAEVCDFIVKVSLGAIVGLLSGRTASTERIEAANKP